jgi:hypothetical protein
LGWRRLGPVQGGMKPPAAGASWALGFGVKAV